MPVAVPGQNGQKILNNMGKDITKIAPPQQTTETSLADAALQYHAAGLRVIPYWNDPDPKKQFPAWAKYREGQTAEQVRQLFAKPCDRVAILTGVGGIEAIDIDTKHDPQKTIDQEFFDLVREDELAAAALEKCVKVRTKSGGRHILYQADNIEGNQKLTTREGSKEAVIETRGIGGLLFAAPSPGYEIESGCYTQIPHISNDERTALISIARLLSARTDAESEAETGSEAKEFTTATETPWNAYNAAHDAQEIAEKYGWRTVRKSGDIIYLNRPGAQHPQGVDAAILTTRAGQRRFYPHTTSSAYNAGKCYSPFAMYAVEEHQGDIKAAARALRAQGYGSPANTSQRRNAIGADGDNGTTEPEFHKDLFWKDEPCYRWQTYTISKGTATPGRIEPIANFVIEPLYHLSDPRSPKRVFAVVNVHGCRAVVCALVKELASLDGFKAVVESKGNFVFYGSARQYSAIKEVWFYYEKTAVEVGTLGYLPGTTLYAFANGIFDGTAFLPIDDFGIVEVGEVRYFIPVFSAIYKGDEGMFQHERKFVHSPASVVKFERWARLFCDAFSENENGRIGLMFVCASLFRTFIAAHANFFPMLFLFGMKGTGKSTFRDSMLSLFGQPQDTVSLGGASSAKGYNRRLGQRRDALQVFEEYKNNITSPLIEMLKGVYDLIGYERAQTTNDNRTHHTPVLSAVAVAGQELPVKENALFSRMITLEFLKTTFTDEQEAAYNELADLQKGNGVTAATLELLRYRSHIEAAFVAAYREMCAMLKDGKAPADLSPEDAETDARLPYTVDERSIHNTALLLAVYRILEKHLAFPFTFGELKETLVSKLKMQVEIMNKTTEVCQFWQAVEVMREQGKILEGRDYKIEKKGNEQWIFIYPTTVFAAYEDHQRRTGGHALDGATLSRYLKRQPGYRPGKDRGDHLIRLQETGGSKQKRCLAFELNSTQNF
jgi:Bifunctional DNA primase/polymerase, N-terminal